MPNMQRDTAPDVLRGFALLGILVVNIQFMGLNSDQGARGEWTQGFANGAATFLIAALFAGKFYLLFSFLEDLFCCKYYSLLLQVLLLTFHLLP